MSPRRDPDFNDREKSRHDPLPSTRAAFVSRADIAVYNSQRPPSQHIVPTDLCGAKTKTAHRQGKAAVSETCTFNAGYGTDHPGFGFCKFHGGNSAAGKKSAALARAKVIAGWRQEEISRLLLEERSVRFGGDKDLIENISPEEALLEEVRRSVAMVRWLEEQIGMWPQEFSTDGLGGLPSLVAESSKGVPGATDHQAWMILYRDERGHMARVAKMAIDGGVAKAQVALAQEQGAMISKGLRLILTSLGLSSLQLELAREIVPQVIKAMSAGTLDALPSDLRQSVTETVSSSATVVGD